MHRTAILTTDIVLRLLLKRRRKMPKPSEWDLDFSVSRKAAAKHIGPSLEILRPLIRFSHELLRDCRDLIEDEVDLVLLTAFRQCLEFADAVDILLRHMVVTPAVAQARSALEHAPQVILLATRRDRVLAAGYLLSSLRSSEHELTRKQDAPGLDEDDRAEIRARLKALEELYAQHAGDRPGLEALTALKCLKRGDPWYAMRGGPNNIHKLMTALDLDALSTFYSDLNPVVHGGMPLLATGAASGLPGSEIDPELLRPLRTASPWAFRAILCTGMAVDLALLHVLNYFAPHLATQVVPRFREFQKEHTRRCERADLSVLGFSSLDCLGEFPG
jgi:hypothetical protein